MSAEIFKKCLYDEAILPKRLYDQSILHINLSPLTVSSKSSPCVISPFDFRSLSLAPRDSDCWNWGDVTPKTNHFPYFFSVLYISSCFLLAIILVYFFLFYIFR